MIGIAKRAQLAFVLLPVFESIEWNRFSTRKWCFEYDEQTDEKRADSSAYLHFHHFDVDDWRERSPQGHNYLCTIAFEDEEMRGTEGTRPGRTVLFSSLEMSVTTNQGSENRWRRIAKHFSFSFGYLFSIDKKKKSGVISFSSIAMVYERTVCNCAWKIFLIAFYIHFILYLLGTSLFPEQQSKFLLSHCRITKEAWDVVACPLKSQAFHDHICLKVFYQILTPDNRTITMDHLPTWIFSNDLNSFIKHSIDSPCYSNPSNLSDIRWTRDDSHQTVQLLAISSFTLFLLFIHTLETTCSWAPLD